MRIAVTGGTGFVGRFIVKAAIRAGHEVMLLSRRAPEGFGAGVRFLPWELGKVPDLAGADALVHAAFAHVPGRYRDGEGDDPAGFLRANRDGSLRLFEGARAAGVPALLQLSTRAVFDGYPAGTALTEDLAPRPASLYGEVKAELEAALSATAAPTFRPVSLRATGVYGIPAAPPQPHKWSGLFAELLAGRPIPPRVSTEVHGDDLAAGVLLLLGAALRDAGRVAETEGRSLAAEGTAKAPCPASGTPMVAHASDIILDSRDLALALARCLGRDDIPLPPRSDTSRVSVLDCATLRALGWQPGGWRALERTVAAMAADSPRTGAAMVEAASSPPKRGALTRVSPEQDHDPSSPRAWSTDEATAKPSGPG